MDAITLLRSDHEAMKQLFEAYAGAGADAAMRLRLTRELKGLWQSHSHVEEEIFYPAVMRVRSDLARECVRQALEDHHLLDGLVAELDQLDPEEAAFDAKMRALRESMERHIGGVEARLFAEAPIHLTDERLERLGCDMVALRDGASADARTPWAPRSTAPGSHV